MAPLDGTIVYVCDFELDIFRTSVFRIPRPLTAAGSAASPAVAKAGSGPTASPAQTSSNSRASKPRASSADADPDEERVNRANELVNAMAQNVLTALRANGYDARRLHWNQSRPEKGLLIRGVFSEPDDQNRARRLLYGGPSTAPKMVLFVGVNDLKNPEQPLYVLASPQSPDSRYGPVITVTPYSPAARFELGKNPADEEIKKIATQIADDFSALLSANPLISTQ